MPESSRKVFGDAVAGEPSSADRVLELLREGARVLLQEANIHCQ